MDILAYQKHAVCHSLKLFAFGFIVLSCSSPCHSEQFTFGLLAKNIHDKNFQQAWRGCEDYAKSVSAECVLFGPSTDITPRDQVLALESALKKYQLDAIAVSVLHSEQLVRTLKNLDTPIFSFDSPFDDKFKAISRSYVGIDNYEFGKKIGRVTNKIQTQGGTYCLLTARNAPNIQQRVNGVRDELTHNKWHEADRCPWFNNESSSQALKQLRTSLLSIRPDVFISVGEWPIFEHKQYKRLIDDLYPSPKKRKTRIIIASGIIEDSQWQLLNDGYLDAIVSIDFYQIGWAISHHMYQSLIGQAIESDEYVSINSYIRIHQ